MGNNCMTNMTGDNNNVTTTSNNFAIGTQALALTTTSNFNVAIGETALQTDTTGSNNVAIGTISLNQNLTGNCNAAIGDTAYNTTSQFNNSTAIGYSSLPFGSNQVMLGTLNETVYCPNTININGFDTSTELVCYNNFTLISIGNNKFII